MPSFIFRSPKLRKIRLQNSVAIFFSIVFFSSSLRAQDESERPPRLLRFDHYYQLKELEAALLRLQQAYPTLARLSSMGRSLEGRELTVLTIRNPLTGADADKPALYVDANTHGNEIQGSEICLYLAHSLLTQYSSDPIIKDLVDRFVFYIAPCVNPDGREAFMTRPNSPHSSRWNRRPKDDDGDGRFDEDDFDDLDGDGNIVLMRIRDPLGRWKSGSDPRIMVPCGADEVGEFRVLGWEGIDNDGDGKFNEDGVGGVDLNRNFPSDWVPENRQFGAGEFPLSEPETRATLDFILARPHIAAIQSFHNAGDMILRPPGAEDDRRVPGEDLALYDALGRRGERTLPGYRYLQTFKDLYRVHGAFLDWGYMRWGVYTFTNELWSFPQDFDKDGRVTEEERLKWNDEMLSGRGFKNWAPLEHPQLGKIELGGWTKMSLRIPPAWQLEDLCYRNSRFVLYHASVMPRLSARKLSARRIPEAPDLTRVEVELLNEGFMATSTARAQATGAARPDIATIRGEGLEILSASSRRELEGLDSAEPPGRPQRVVIGRITGQGRVIVSWIVRGAGEALVELRSEKGGLARTSFVIGPQER